MQLDQLKLALRRRNPWEALDLGLVMLRHWRGPIYRVWFATFLPFALLVYGLLWTSPSVALFIVWWLKPFFDRILLKVYAEASFGTAPSVRDVWRAVPGLLRRSGLMAGLSFRRFNTSRSFDLPVWQLEGQRGKAARARLRVLGRRTGGYAFWLIFVCSNIVAIYEFGFVSLFDLFTPTDGAPVFSWSDLVRGESSDWAIYLFNLSWLAAESIVEPFFVAAGFSLYLNRRSELEGWDIEVAFRRMSERHRQARTATGSVLGHTLMIALLAGCLLWGLSLPTDASAQEATPAAPSAHVESAPPPTPRSVLHPDGAVAKVAKQVLADPVFGHEVEEMSWQPINKDEQKPPGDIPWWAKKLIKIAEMVARGTRALLYLLLCIAAAGALVLLYRYRHLVTGYRPLPFKPPETLFGLDLRPASLPTDITRAALAELDAGRFAAALSLLYRGALVSLIHKTSIEFRAGDTEDDCLHRVSGRVDAQTATYFAQLLNAWKPAAYAETPPDAATARDLCQRWAQHFGERGPVA